MTRLSGYTTKAGTTAKIAFDYKENPLRNFNYDFWNDLGCDTQIGVGNFYETIIEFVYRKVLQQGDVAIDGGANRGRHTIPMARVVKQSGLVIGFEAIPGLANSLAQKIGTQGLKNIQIINKAIGSKEGQSNFTFVAKNDAYSGLRMREGIPEDDQSSVENITVATTTLDLEITRKQLSRVRFIKLDLEGGEYDALLGSREILDKMSPFIIFENGREMSARVYGYDKDAWFVLFERSGYKLFDLFGRPFAPQDWDNAGVPWYFVAVKRSIDKEFVHCQLPAMVETIANFYALQMSLK